MLGQILSVDLFVLTLVFARVGSAIMLLPGFGEVFVPTRVRLLIALAITVVMVPAVAPNLPPEPATLLGVFALLGGEITFGVFIGMLARMLVSSLHFAGVVIGYQTGLANAHLFDPVNASQGSLFGAFLNVLGVFLIFISDLHHLILAAIAKSYQVYVPGQALPTGDLAQLMVGVLSQSLILAMQISAPFIIVGMLFYTGLGLLMRLMPQVQLFFIAMPLQIMLGFTVLSLTLSAGMIWFLNRFESIYLGMLGVG